MPFRIYVFQNVPEKRQIQWMIQITVQSITSGFKLFKNFIFCCRQKFLAQKCVIFVWLKVKMCRNGSFCVEISAGNKIKIFESIIARRIFCIITMRFYLSKPAISSWSKFCNGKVFFFNVTGVQKIGEQLLENFQV